MTSSLTASLSWPKRARSCLRNLSESQGAQAHQRRPTKPGHVMLEGLLFLTGSMQFLCGRASGCARVQQANAGLP